MKVKTLILLSMVLVVCCMPGQAQSSAEVSVPELSMTAQGIQIAFNILHSSDSDRFSIRIEITNERGQKIDAKSLSGDIGKGIAGGPGKIIIWDIEADGLFLDEEIFVQVFASPEPSRTMPEEQAEEALPAGQSFKRSGLILQSIAFPGLGLSRINPGKPHWIRGALGYGCIGGAVYLNRQAIKNYDAYLDAGQTDDIDDLFNKAEQQDQISEILGFAAIGIWVTDIIWTILGTSDLTPTLSSERLTGFSIGTRIEPVSSVPMVALRYKF